MWPPSADSERIASGPVAIVRRRVGVTRLSRWFDATEPSELSIHVLTAMVFAELTRPPI